MRASLPGRGAESRSADEHRRQVAIVAAPSGGPAPGGRDARSWRVREERVRGDPPLESTRLNPGWSSRCDGWRSDSGHRRTSSVVFLKVRSFPASLRTAARSHSGNAAKYAEMMNKKLMATPPS